MVWVTKTGSRLNDEQLSRIGCCDFTFTAEDIGSTYQLSGWNAYCSVYIPLPVAFQLQYFCSFHVGTWMECGCIRAHFALTTHRRPWVYHPRDPITLSSSSSSSYQIQGRLSIQAPWTPYYWSIEYGRFLCDSIRAMTKSRRQKYVARVQGQRVPLHTRDWVSKQLYSRLYNAMCLPNGEADSN